MPQEKRHIQEGNMIYFGDGLTDVPCMKLVKQQGGKQLVFISQVSLVKLQIYF